MSAVSLRTIVIVGGGFCGAVLATMLLGRPPAGPTRLVLIERGERVGRAWPSRAITPTCSTSLPAAC